jgi:hypothetical protein
MYWPLGFKRLFWGRICFVYWFFFKEITTSTNFLIRDCLNQDRFVIAYRDVVTSACNKKLHLDTLSAELWKAAKITMSCMAVYCTYHCCYVVTGRRNRSTCAGNWLVGRRKTWLHRREGKSRWLVLWAVWTVSCLRFEVLCVQCKTPDDGQRNCPKHVEFHFKNKFEKLVHLVCFIMRNLSWCKVTWTSDVALARLP